MIWRDRPSTPCPSRDGLATSYLSEPDRYESHRHHCRACSRVWAEVQQVASQLADTYSRDPRDCEARDGKCPDVAAWAALADGRVPDWARVALVAHMAECDDCSTLWSYMVDVEEPEDEDMRQAVESERPSAGEHDHPSRTTRLLIAAAGLATLMVYVISPPPAIEGGGAERWRGPVPHLDSEVRGSIEADRPFIQWRPWPGADSFRLRVWDLEGNLLIDHYLEGSSLAWHLSIDAPISGTLYWLVEAVQNGRVVAAGEIGVITIPNSDVQRSPNPQ